MRITSDFYLLILFRDAGCAIRVSYYGLRVLHVTRISQHETFFTVTATDHSSFNFRLRTSDFRLLIKSATGTNQDGR